MTNSTIELRDISVRAGGHTILETEHLAFNSGEFVAVMGPNGAGKSTLLRTCLGFQRSVRGHVSVLGSRLDALNGLRLTRLRRSLGYVPQALPARPEMPLTVREVVSIGRAGRVGLLRPLRALDHRVINEWLDRLGLGPLAGRAFHELSGGEQRKAVIARAMAQEPQWLLLDEPTANLDVGWRERMVDLMESLYAGRKLGVILVCHDLEALPPCCRRVVLLDSGRVLADGEPDEIFSPERVARLYGPGITVHHHAGRHGILPGRRGS